MRIRNVVVIVNVATVTAGVAVAYDRNAAVDYARQYTDASGVISGGPYNSAVYNRYDYDCANFGSQCINAGGVRFRASGSTNSNPNKANEFETGKETWAILNNSTANDTTKYSRIIHYAQTLFESITHQRHAGRDFSTNDEKADNGIVWNTVKPGDLTMHITGGRGGHTMVVTQVVTENPKDVKFCAHSSWRLDKPLLELRGQWKTDAEYHVIHLPDAPRISKLHLYGWDTYDESKELAWRWVTNKCDGYDNLPKVVGKSVGLWIAITFDCDMKTNESAVVRLLMLGLSPIAFDHCADEEGEFANGWRIGVSGGRIVQNRTWCGFIAASSLPGDKNVVAKIGVSAKGADGSQNDSDNALDKYNPGECQSPNCQLDTRKVAGEKK